MDLTYHLSTSSVGMGSSSAASMSQQNATEATYGVRKPNTILVVAGSRKH